MLQRELASRMEEDESLSRQSAPFLTFLVKSSNGDCKERGLVTIWRVRENQLSMIKEGKVVRFHNLSVKSARHDGQIQFTANETTQMEVIPSLQCSWKMGFQSRKFTKLVHVHIQSKKSGMKGQHLRCSATVDICGIMLQVNQFSHCHKYHIIDESGLVVRVEREGEVRDLEGGLSLSPIQRSADPVPIGFRDVKVLPFDFVENCAVVAFVQTSSITTKGRNCRLEELLKLRGDPILSRAACSLQAQIPIFPNQLAGVLVCVGFISGLELVAQSESLHLLFDCGRPRFLAVELPFCLVPDALASFAGGDEEVSFRGENSAGYKELKVVSRILSARGVLLRLVLQQKHGGSIEVRQIERADPEAVSALYIANKRCKQK